MEDRALDRRMTLALMLYSMGLVVALLIAGVGVTYDDGFYYFKIAQQVASGAGSTFDGLHVTNGYHPLWLLCLVPLFWLAPTPDTALGAGTLLQGALLAGDVALIYAIARLTCGRLAASLAALLWALLTYRLAVSGLEFGLHALGLLATVYVYLRWFASGLPGRRTYLALGLLASLTFLARIDTLALAGVLGLALGWRELRAGPTSDGLKRLLAFSLPVIVVSTVYAGVNLWLVGQPLPISGVVKRAWSSYLLVQDAHYQSAGWLVAKIYQLFWPLEDLPVNLKQLVSPGGGGIGLNLGNALYSAYMIVGTFGVAALFLAGLCAPRPGCWQAWFRTNLRPLGPFALFSLLQLIGYALLYHGGLSAATWYYAIQPCLTVLLVAALVERVLSIGRPAGRAGHAAIWARRLLLPLVLLAWCGLLLYPFWSLKQWQDARRRGLARQPLYDLARWVGANLPADAVIGAWNAGTLGFLSGRRVVNLDGLVNSWEYQQTGRYDLCSYWRQVGITYLADSFADRRAVSVVPVYPAYMACVDRLERIWTEPGRSDYGRMEVYQVRSPSITDLFVPSAGP
jgi:hypothetical protein